MKLNKKYISPIFTILAMVLLLISNFISEQPMDWLAYLAIAVIIASVVGMIMMHKQS